MVYLLIGGRYCIGVVVGQPRRPCFCVVVLVLGALVVVVVGCWWICWIRHFLANSPMTHENSKMLAIFPVFLPVDG